MTCPPQVRLWEEAGAGTCGTAWVLTAVLVRLPAAGIAIILPFPHAPVHGPLPPSLPMCADGVTCMVRWAGGRRIANGGMPPQATRQLILWQGRRTAHARFGILHALFSWTTPRPPPLHAHPPLPHLQEQRMYGQCNSTYLTLGNYCRDTCSRCTVLEGAAPGPEPAPADGGQQPPVVAAAGGGRGRRLI